MTIKEQIAFTKVTTLLIGLAFIPGVLTAPIGIYIIWWGRRAARRMEAKAEEASTVTFSDTGSTEEALAWGVATSWDDVT
jgi:hypothetical protein